MREFTTEFGVDGAVLPPCPVPTGRPPVGGIVTLLPGSSPTGGAARRRTDRSVGCQPGRLACDHGRGPIQRRRHLPLLDAVRYPGSVAFEPTDPLARTRCPLLAIWGMEDAALDPRYERLLVTWLADQQRGGSTAGG